MNINTLNLILQAIIFGFLAVFITDSAGAQPAQPTIVSTTLVKIPNSIKSKFTTLSDENYGQLDVEWKGVSFAEKKLELTGTLFITRGGLRVNVPWQGVRVLVGRQPGVSLDWSRGHDSKTTAWRGSFADGDGRFNLQLPLWEISRPVTDPGTHQIGLVLGVIRDGTVEWKTDQPAVKKSIRRVSIKGQPKLDKAVSLINACPDSLGWNHDPLPLIRATNHLRSLGKTQAIKELKLFCSLANEIGPDERIKDQIDTSDMSCLNLLIPLLFPSQTDEGRPPAKIVGPSSSYHIFLFGDIPFHNVRFSGASRSGQDTMYLVDWAEKYGRLREKELIPLNNPLMAVDAACESLAKKFSEDGQSRMPRDLKQHLRWQAWRMVNKNKQIAYDDPLFASDISWSNFVNKISENLIWHRGLQDYTTK